ncbi:DUF4012 domain-containing protein [Patescibacteria group bacterium]|nr:MAG: DUF4012 domain-containing protein [Patescibacteria group bacterium]
MARNDSDTMAKIQLRRCALCQEPGHNKSTCPQRHDFEVAKPSAALHFFVHHTNRDSSPSPHVVNLKEKEELWRDIESCEPEHGPKNDDYYFYHIKHAGHDDPRQTPVVNILPQDLDAPTPRPLPKKSQPKNDKKFFSGAVRSFRKTFTPARAAVIVSILTLVAFAPSSAQNYYLSVKSTAATAAESGAAAFSALRDSTAAIMSGQLDLARSALENALRNFNLAVETLNSNHRFLQTAAASLPIVGRDVSGKQKLLLAGQAIARGNAELLQGATEMERADADLAKKLNGLVSYIQLSVPEFQKALASLKDVSDDSLPENFQPALQTVKSVFPALVNDLSDIARLAQSISEISGARGLRRYLLIFQNPNEIRATGGFMGSFALLEIEDGKMRNLTVPPGGSYDLQGQLDTYLEPPAPLLLSNKRWEFQDANWFPDFPASAQKILWFYRHSRGITADGVIAINATALNRALELTGPVADKKRGLILAKDNALDVISKVVEFGPEKKDKKPKQILSDLAPIFADYFQNLKAGETLPALSSLLDALQKKEIQVYFNDKATQNIMEEFGWAGKMANTYPDQDYLMVVNSNLQGQKSDAAISQLVSHQAVAQADGSIIDSVVIERKHNGVPGEPLYGQTNIDYIRVYVPAGSELKSASGFVWPDEKKFKAPAAFYQKDAFLAGLEKEIAIDDRSGTRVTDEFGKRAFGNWLITEPGQTSRVEFVYQLPWLAFAADKANSLKWAEKIFGGAISARYQLVAQKQSGVESAFESQFIFPAGWTPVWRQGENMTLAGNGADVSQTMLDTDKIWSLVLEKE